MRILQKKKTPLQSRNNININMFKNIIKEANLESMADLEKNFRVQTQLRQYAPCEHNSIDEVRYSSQGPTHSGKQIIVFDNINIL